MWQLTEWASRPANEKRSSLFFCGATKTKKIFITFDSKAVFTLAKSYRDNESGSDMRPQTSMHATVAIGLAWANLGSATNIGSFLYFVALPKVAKASTEVTAA